MLAATLLILFLPRFYRATAVIKLNAQDRSDTTVIPESFEQRLLTVQKEIRKTAFLQDIIRQQDGSETSTQADKETLKTLRRDLAISGNPSDETISITFTGQNPKRVMNITQKIASLFIQRRKAQEEEQAAAPLKAVQDEIAHLKDKTEGTEKRLEQQEKALNQFKQKHGDALTAQLPAYRQKQASLQSELKKIDAKIKTKEEKIKKEEPITEPGLTDIHPLTEKWLMKKRELYNLQRQHPDSHPDVMALKDELADLEKQLAVSEERLASDRKQAKKQGQVKAALGREITALKKDKKRVTEEIQHYEHLIAAAPKREEERASLLMDYEILQRTYQDLLDKHTDLTASAKTLSEALEKRKREKPIRIIQTASLPKKPYKPNLLKIGVTGVLTGFLTGVLLVGIRARMDRSVHTEAELEQLLSLPVLVSIADHNEVAGGPRKPSIKASPPPPPREKSIPSLRIAG